MWLLILQMKHIVRYVHLPEFPENKEKLIEIKNHKGRRSNLEEGKSTHLNRESSLHTKITDKNQ